MRILGISTAFCVALAGGSVTRTAKAEDPPTVVWSEDWPRFRTLEGVATAVAAAHIVSVLLIYPEPKRNWTGGILFDDAVRDVLRIKTKGGRERAARVSDFMYYGLAAYPALVDTVIVADHVHRAPDVAGEMMAMNLEAYAISGAIALTLERLGRVRPSEQVCRIDPNYADCEDVANLNASFLSGHTAAAFVGAGLTCAHHQHLPLYGGGFADLAACLGMVSLAGTSGVLRVMSDNHYATDVLLGASIGFLGGYGLPSLFHYGFTSGSKRRTATFLPTFRTEALGTPAFAVLAPVIDGDSLQLSFSGSY